MNDEVRSRAYDLFGSLLLGNRAAVAEAREISPFDSMLRDRPDEEIAAEHYQMFGLEVFPYAGVFTSQDALVGGEIAEKVSQSGGTGGTSPLDETRLAEQSSESPDHLGCIMRRIARHLARTDREQAADLICECVLPWIVPWGAAVERQPPSFWSDVAVLTLALIGEHGSNLVPTMHEFGAPLSPNEATSVGEIAVALTSPSVTGALLTRQDISSLARKLELPTGFGPRRLMLTNLLRASADYDRSAKLLEALGFFFGAASDAYQDVARTAGLANECASAWASRAAATAATLQAMKGQLAALS